MSIDQYLFIALMIFACRGYRVGWGDRGDWDLILITSLIWPVWLLFKAGEAFNDWRE